MAVYQTLSITQLSQDPERNTSVVRVLWKSTQTGASYNMVEATGVYAVYTNGQELLENVRYVLPKQTEQVILDKEFVIFHDPKGQALVEVETWMDTKISAGQVKLYEKLQLPTIPRVSQVLASDGIIGKSSRLAITRKNSTYSHSIAWSFGSQQGYLNENGEICQEEVLFSKEGLDFLLPDSFYQEIPNQKSDSCTLTIRTYSDGVPVGQPQTSAFLVSADEKICRPSLSGSVVDVNPATRSLTGDERILVQNVSIARCTVISVPRKGATIVRKTIAGTEVEDSLEIAAVQSGDFLFTATDSRGFTTDFAEPVDMVFYVPVNCEAVAERLSPVSGDAVLKLSGNFFAGSFGLAENKISMAYSIGNGEQIPVESVTCENNRYYAEVPLSAMDYTKVYNVTVWVSDLLTSTVKRTTLKKGVPVFDWGENDFAFHVPVKMDQPLSVENGGTGGTTPAACWQNLGLCLNMEPDVEYATWERWNGKPVYTKLLCYGSMPNSNRYGVLHHCGASAVLRCFGTTSDGRTLPFGGSRGDKIELYADRTAVYLDTQLDESAHTAYVQLFYTKN